MMLAENKLPLFERPAADPVVKMYDIRENM